MAKAPNPLSFIHGMNQQNQDLRLYLHNSFLLPWFGFETRKSWCFGTRARPSGSSTITSVSPSYQKWVVENFKYTLVLCFLLCIWLACCLNQCQGSKQPISGSMVRYQTESMTMCVCLFQFHYWCSGSTWNIISALWCMVLHQCYVLNH